jgi:hypothetical protein
MSYTHVKQFVEFKGVDLRSSDLTRPRGFATGSAKNFAHTPQGGLKTRNGSKIVMDNMGQAGLFAYEATDMTGSKKSELIMFGSALSNAYVPYKLEQRSLSILNAGAAAVVSHYYDEATSQFRFKILRGASSVVDLALGLGTEAAPVSLSTLDSTVDAAADLEMTYTSASGDPPAAFMELLDDATLGTGETLTIYYYGYVAVYSSAGSSSDYVTCKNSFAAIGSAIQRNVSCVQINGVLYISPGNVDSTDSNVERLARVMKYDGQMLYRAGFPNKLMTSLEIVSGLGGTATGSKDTALGTLSFSPTLQRTYSWMVTIVRVDNAGNEVESARSGKLSSANFSTTNSIGSLELRGYAEIFTGSNGYGYLSAQVNGGQAGVLTITTDSGGTLRVGDVAFFYDSAQGRSIQRKVTAVASTSVTISATSLDTNPSSASYDTGGNVTVLDNAIITNNFRLRIWRTKQDGSTYYLQSDRPFGTSLSTTNALGETSYIEYDNAADTTLGAAYIEPEYPRDEPPAGKYLARFNSQLIVTGIPNKSSTVAFSDDGPEYFSPGTHEFDLPGDVTGVHQTSEVLACGTATSLHVVSGDLLNFNFRVSQISDKIGVTSHHAMSEAMEGLLMFPSLKGPYVLAGGRALEPLGATIAPDGSRASRLEPYFTQTYGPTGPRPALERAHAAVIGTENLYVLWVPYEDQARPTFDNGSGVAFAYDYSRDAWYRWTGLNMGGGLAALGNDLYWASRAYDGSGTADYSNMTSAIYQRQTRKGKYNYADHGTAIAFDYRAGWEMLGNPDSSKRPLRASVRSLETRDQASMAVTVKTFLDFDETLVSTNNTITFTTEKAIKPKLKSPICHAVQMSFQSSAYYSPVLISGYQLELTAEFKQEIGK